MSLHSFGIQFLWVIAQVTLFLGVGCVAYLLCARRGPAYRSMLAAGTLLVALTMTALAVSPWPRWYDVSLSSGQLAESVSSDAGSEPADSTSVAGSSSSVNGGESNARADAAAPATELNDPGQSAFRVFMQALQTALIMPEPVAERGAPWRWPAVVGAVVLTGIVVGLLRIVIGLWAISHYRRRAQPVDDKRVLAELDSLRISTGCRQPVLLCESASIGTPATIGWRRPLILLPVDWRSWDADDRRAVLAHELGHIARGDFVAGIIARLTTALHFYHPLAHWLARRMRFEQELAADACGVALSGGKESYVIAIARMALQQDTQRLAWAARPFFPTRSTFLRRIEMLRSTSGIEFSPQRPTTRGFVFGMLAIVALVIVGFRVPLDAPRSIALGADPAKPATDAGKLELKNVPANTVFYAAGRPASILARDEKLREVAATVNRETNLDDNLGIALKDLAEFQLMVVNTAPADESPQINPVAMLRATKPYDWKPLVQAADKVEAREYAGQKYFGRAATDRRAPVTSSFYFMPDDHTIVISSLEAALRAYIDAQKNAAMPRWADAFKRVEQSDAAIVADMELFGGLAEKQAQRVNEPTMLSFAPLWRNAETIVVGAKLNGKLTAAAYAICKSPDQAASVAETVTAARVLGQNILPALTEQAGHAQLPAELAKLQAAMIKEIEGFLGQVKPRVEGNVVAVKVEGSEAFGPLTAAVVMPAAAKAREGAQRAQSMNNLKQIALAMHMYADQKGAFPPAAVLGPDGKTPHSWRVALLPYLEQEQLFKQYNQNEPWDSENNRKVLEKMPAVYLHPAAKAPPAKLTTSCYYVLTGEGALFSSSAANKGVKLQDITDGTSNTLLVVEAKRDIPWTKPGDIPFDAAGELPKLGEFQQDGFAAAFADGSARFLSKRIDPQLLKALITIKGGENARIE
jgi:beta-lactamase regulating signal transducer with metallopeptidase domain